MDQLPQDVLLGVFAILPTRDILAMGCTCRELAAAISDDRFWRSRFFVEYRPRAPMQNSPTAEPQQYVYRYQHSIPTSWRELYIRREQIFYQLSKSNYSILKEGKKKSSLFFCSRPWLTNVCVAFERFGVDGRDYNDRRKSRDHIVVLIIC